MADTGQADTLTHKIIKMRYGLKKPCVSLCVSLSVSLCVTLSNTDQSCILVICVSEAEK